MLRIETKAVVSGFSTMWNKIRGFEITLNFIIIIEMNKLAIINTLTPSFNNSLILPVFLLNKLMFMSNLL